MAYCIEFIGCCGQECSANFEGDIPGLLQEITWIEERGGWGITATDEAGEFVYEDGKVVSPKPILTGLLFTEAELLSGLTPYLAHADEVASLSAGELGI